MFLYMVPLQTRPVCYNLQLAMQYYISNLAHCGKPVMCCQILTAQLVCRLDAAVRRLRVCLHPLS